MVWSVIKMYIDMILPINQEVVVYSETSELGSQGFP